MNLMRLFSAGCTVAGFCLLVGVGPAVAEVIVDLRHFEDNHFEQEYFRLERPMQLQVKCEGAGEQNDPSLFAYGWLLEAATRKVPWVLEWKNSRRSGQNRSFEGTIELDAGDYIASYGAFWSGRERVIKIFDREIFRISGGKHRISSKESRRWKLVISTVQESDAAFVENLSRPPEIGDERTFVKLAPMQDDEYQTQGFTLTEDTKVEVYCQGEYVPGSDGPVDLGWIQDAKTRERVWEFSPRNFRHGGGSFKNKLTRQMVTLAAGNYVAGYATDGSHSASGWNAFPPYDPDGWGLILFAASTKIAARIAPYSDEDSGLQPLVSLNEQGDYVFSRQGFQIAEPTQLRVYAMGEYDFDNHQFVDEGWIEEFGTGKVVWKMKRRNTRHAGGAARNLVAEDIVDFDAGKYVAYYTSDDSHSFRRFRSAPPHDPRYWGITLTTTDADFDRSKVTLFDAAVENQEALVRLVRVPSGEHLREVLKLDNPTKVRIVAVGEGDYEEMYDYAWIENRRNGRWVWEMRYKETRHAGGARKNRLYDRIIELEPGEYEVNFITDDSHAWGDWNRAHPHKPQDWGITVSLAPE